MASEDVMLGDRMGGNHVGCRFSLSEDNVGRHMALTVCSKLIGLLGVLLSYSN